MPPPDPFAADFRPAETALTKFLAEHIEALISASALLGGRPAVSRTARLLEDVLDAQRITRRLRREPEIGQRGQAAGDLCGFAQDMRPQRERQKRPIERCLESPRHPAAPDESVPAQM